MRPTSTTLAALLVLASLSSGLPAAAQDGTGCAHDNPCSIEVAVDARGFSGERNWTVTVGDWHELIVSNLDPDDAHHVRVPAFGIDLMVGPLEDVRSHPFAAESAGEFAVTDEPSQESAWIIAFEQDTVAVEDVPEETDGNVSAPPEGPPADEDAAGPLVPVLLLGLLAVALRRR